MSAPSPYILFHPSSVHLPCIFLQFPHDSGLWVTARLLTYDEVHSYQLLRRLSASYEEVEARELYAAEALRTLLSSIIDCNFIDDKRGLADTFMSRLEARLAAWIELKLLEANALTDKAMEMAVGWLETLKNASLDNIRTDGAVSNFPDWSLPLLEVASMFEKGILPFGELRQNGYWVVRGVLAITAAEGEYMREIRREQGEFSAVTPIFGGREGYERAKGKALKDAERAYERIVSLMRRLEENEAFGNRP